MTSPIRFGWRWIGSGIWPVPPRLCMTRSIRSRPLKPASLAPATCLGLKLVASAHRPIQPLQPPLASPPTPGVGPLVASPHLNAAPCRVALWICETALGEWFMPIPTAVVGGNLLQGDHQRLRSRRIDELAHIGGQEQLALLLGDGRDHAAQKMLSP